MHHIDKRSKFNPKSRLWWSKAKCLSEANFGFICFFEKFCFIFHLFALNKKNIQLKKKKKKKLIIIERNIYLLNSIWFQVDWHGPIQVQPKNQGEQAQYRHPKYKIELLYPKQIKFINLDSVDNFWLNKTLFQIKLIFFFCFHPKRRALWMEVAEG